MISAEPVAAACGVTLVRHFASCLSLYSSFLLAVSEKKSHIYHFPRTACRFGDRDQRCKYHRNLTPVRLGSRFRQIQARMA